jgi:hypothetical protein
MNTLRKHITRISALALVAGATTLGSAAYLKAQNEIIATGCEFRTRWKDAFGDCPACCDARAHGCPCTV